MLLFIHSERGCNISLFATLISLFVGESDVACQTGVCERGETRFAVLIYSPVPGVVETNEPTVK